MEKSQEELIQKVMAFMRAGLSEPLSIPDLAKKTGYSHSHLRFIFRKATGKGILSHFLELRIDKAKKLLRDTNLTVSEIAFECGFASYERFRAAFTEKAGCAPGNFRKSQGISDPASAVLPKGKKEALGQCYYESLKGPELSSSFEPISGNWKQQTGHLGGTSSGNVFLLFKKPMPENFILRFEACLFRKAGLSSTEIGIFLCNAENLQEYHAFVLGRMDGAFGEFRTQGTSLLFNPKAIFRQETWHKIQMELEDDTISLLLDGEELFKHRDPFPPPFALRSHLAIVATNSEIGLRELAVFDRGFLPLVKSVRQGDSLYNGGFFSSARDFYLRLLASRISTADAMELRYKIGQCFFREENYSQALGWMQKVIALPQTNFWADLAKLALLEIDVKEDRLEEFQKSLGILFEKPHNRQAVRLILNRACADFSSRGFFEKSLILRNLLFLLEEPNSFSHIETEYNVAENLLQIRKFKESEKHFISVIENPNTPTPQRMYVLFSFCSNLGMQGKLKKVCDTIKELEALSAFSPVDASRSTVYRAIYYRAAGRPQDALSELTLIRTKYETVPYWAVFSLLLGAQILCCEGNIKKARAWLKEVTLLDPAHPRLSKGLKSIAYYPVELAAGNYAEAARYLIEDSQVNRGISNGAEQAIKAGILLCLAQKQDEALAIWKRTAVLFPQKRFNFYESFAQSLAAGKTDGADEMPYPAEKRSEMFYLLGLYCEARGDGAQAKDFFKQSAEEDLLLDWPACMAKKKL